MSLFNFFYHKAFGVEYDQSVFLMCLMQFTHSVLSILVILEWYTLHCNAFDKKTSTYLEWSYLTVCLFSVEVCILASIVTTKAISIEQVSFSHNVKNEPPTPKSTMLLTLHMILLDYHHLLCCFMKTQTIVCTFSGHS